MSTKVGGNAIVKKTKRVFLHTGTAYEGYAVNYNWDAMGLDAENNAFTTQYGRSLGTTIDYWCDARRVMVEAPDENNSLHFAGVVDKCSNGVVGPNWIQVNTPGSICNIFASLSAAAGANKSDPRNATEATRNNGGMLTFNIATGTAIDGGEFKYSGYPGEGSAMCLQVASSTDTLIMAELMTGPPSGGVQCCAWGTATNYSAGVTITPSGVTFITSATLAASGVGYATISAGAYPGARKKIAFGAAVACLSSLGAAISCAVPVRVGFLSATIVVVASIVEIAHAVKAFTSGDTITFASAGSGHGVDYVELEWQGAKWLLIGSGGTVMVT